jgi:hypothetical protein
MSSRPLRARWLAAAVVAVCIALPQVVLFAPSLAGRKILLPIDILTAPGMYLPRTTAYAGVQPQDLILSDQVLIYEPLRHFIAAEYRAGRVPLWMPDEFCGCPLAVFPKYSLFDALYYLFPTPFSLPWVQLAKSLAAGFGAFLFFRRVLGARFRPAVAGAACYPITGFFMLWQGYYLSYTLALFPWLLLAVDRVVRRPAGPWGPALAVLTALGLTVGAIDIAGQVLLAVGLFALWRLIGRYRRRWGRAAAAAGTLAAAWVLGFLLAAPFLLPLAEYLPTGARMNKRSRGTEERPPVGLTALPQAVLPLTYGSSRIGSVYLYEKSNLLESAAGASAGLLAALVLAPLAWCRRRLRCLHLFWVLQIVLGLAWSLDLPLLVPLLRLPGLNMFSFNRFTFVTGFALTALAVGGLDVLDRGAPARRRWYALPALLLLVLTVWCLARAAAPPGPLTAQKEAEAGRGPGGTQRQAAIRAARSDFQGYHLWGMGLTVAGLAAWAAFWRGVGRRPWLVPLAGIVWAGELLVCAWDVNPQCDPALYYPPLPALEELARRPAGRILGIRCLPPMLNVFCGLRDVRGYDAVDPRELVELLATVQDRQFTTPEYAATLGYVPRVPAEPAGPLRLPPVLNLLNVRYLVCRGRPPGTLRPIIQHEDYWVWENEAVLPRAFVPASVRPAPDRQRLLDLLGSADFDPRQVAYAETALALPDSCRGQAEVVAETSSHLTLKLDMQTPGLVVLSDLWYAGWEARLDGRPVEVLRVNHALRGVAAPAGTATLEFDYRPASFVRGVRLLLGALVVLLAWAALLGVRRLRAARPVAAGQGPVPAGPEKSPRPVSRGRDRRRPGKRQRKP